MIRSFKNKYSESLKLSKSQSGPVLAPTIVIQTATPLEPDRPFHNFRASKSGNRRTFCEAQKRRATDFEALKL